MSKSEDWYETELRELQIALVKFQQWAIAEGKRSIVVFEGRDGAGKDGAIKRITEHLSPRNTRVAALPKPSDRDLTSWYFQRYVAHLPAAGEIVLFNRSWYNRAGVEVVMEFSTPEQQAEFLRDAPTFERMLVESGVKVVKLWLDISKKEQSERLEARREDPLKALKVSPLDAVAQKKWTDYSKARDTMLSRTQCSWAPWTVVHTDKKKQARIAIIRHLLHVLGPAEIARDVPPPDPSVLYTFDETALTDGRLEA